MFSTEETIHAKVPIGRLQGTDDKTRLIALALMLDVEPAYLVVGKEIRDSSFGTDLIHLSWFTQDDQVHLLAQVTVQFLRTAFLEGHHYAHRNILCQQGGKAHPQVIAIYHKNVVILFANPIRNSMKTILLVVGKTVEPHFVAAIGDYVQRTKRYLSFDLEVIPELKNTKSLSEEVQKEKEGELILKALQPGDVVVLLDEGGKEMRSMEFADYMKRKMNTVNKRLVFIIGGPYGFAPKVYAAAHEKMSLSRMTFSHQMVRLIFVEQLYRAMSILNGSPYHHE